jgi:hypothetical protein
VDTFPASVPLNDFNLQAHIEILQNKQDKAAEWTL